MTHSKFEPMALFDQMTVGVCLTDNERITYLNPAAEKLLALPLNQVRGTSLCHLLCSGRSERARGAHSRHAVSGPRNLCSKNSSATFDVHYSRRLKHEIAGDERARDLHVRCHKIHPRPEESDTRTQLTLIEDVTTKTHLEKKQEDWRNMIAHDLRAPLCNIYSALRLMHENSESGAANGPPDAELVRIGVDNCRRMITLLDLYLDASKMAAGCVNTVLEALNVSNLVTSCVTDQAPLARERRITLNVDVPSGLTVMSDADLLPRVFQNLINNALKFTPEDGRVEISAADAGEGGVQIVVKDTGPGIAPGGIRHLFDRYRQAKGRNSGGIRGTGLGLTFCRKAAKALHADIRVESKVGEGSSFILRLPTPAARRRRLDTVGQG